MRSDDPAWTQSLGGASKRDEEDETATAVYKPARADEAVTKRRPVVDVDEAETDIYDGATDGDDEDEDATTEFRLAASDSASAAVTAKRPIPEEAVTAPRSIVAGTIVGGDDDHGELGGTGSTGTTRSIGPEGVISKPAKSQSYRDLPGVSVSAAAAARSGKRGRRRGGTAWRIVWRLLIAMFVLGLLGALAGVGGVVGIFWYYGRGVEGTDVAAIRNYRPKQVTKITARDGTVIGELYSQRRTLVQIEDIPKHVELAFLAAEDADFHNHEGMDYMGMARALISNLRTRSIRQGASTITQQVVKNFLLSPERTLERKVQELILARRLEKALSKDEILELYLNEIYFGHGRYGVEEASQFYFGTSVRKISLGQAAVLAALPKAPSKASPYKDPERAKVRQVYVLQQMVRHGFATAQDADAAIDSPLEVLEKPREAVAVEGAQEFVDAARTKLVEIYGEDKLETLGATVTTTVDLDLQRQARQAVRDGLIALDSRQGYGHKVKPLSEKRQKRARAKVKGDIAVGKTYPVIIGERAPALKLGDDEVYGTIGEQGHKIVFRVPPRYDETDASLAEQFPATGVTMVRVTALAGAGEAEGDTGDKAEKPENDGARAEFATGVIDSGPEAALVLAESESGEVLAMIGGYTQRRGDFNRVLDARRQPGSSFKPFVYGAALASERYTAASLISDSPEIYEKWRPTNYEVDKYRGDIRMRVAITHSVNTVAIKLLDSVGIEAVHSFARAAGIRSELSANLSLALGTSEIAPFELLAGYLTLARRGSRIDPILIRRIEAPGQPEWEPVQRGEQALREDVVFILTSLMTSVVEEGTGRGAKKLGRPVAGKTGTSAELRDGWFGGFTPRHVAVAWVGFDTPKKLGKGESGGRAALPIWLSAMQAAEESQAPSAFVPPASVLVRSIDKATGLLAPDAIPQADGSLLAPPPESVMEEYFISGTEPVDRAEPAAAPPGDSLLDLYGPGADPGAAPDLAPDGAPALDGTPGEEPVGDAVLDLYGGPSGADSAGDGSAGGSETAGAGNSPTATPGTEGVGVDALPSVLDE